MHQTRQKHSCLEAQEACEVDEANVSMEEKIRGRV